MTERLYYTNSYLTEFESEVISCAPAGEVFGVTLGATAFYPTGGGQPNDLGALGGRAVLDVIDREDGVVHVLDGPLVPGARVRGVIDWARRFDHMQQHSGQHMLSAAFEALSRARTSSFHLGAVSCTIDLDLVLSAPDIKAAEDEVNRVVWLDREVRVCFASADEGEALSLRKESARTGTLRLIEVADFDRSACGGTHVSRTGAVGIIAVTGWEKFKGGTRVEFVCGGRALQRIREWRDVFSATSRVLSVLPAGLAPAIERLQAENKAQGKRMRELQARLAVHKAAELVSARPRGEDGRLTVVEALEGWDASGLSALASSAAARPGVCAVLFSISTPALVAVGCAPDSGVNASAVVKSLLGRFGGKGGGKAELAQAGGLTGDPAQMTAAARALLEA